MVCARLLLQLLLVSVPLLSEVLYRILWMIPTSKTVVVSRVSNTQSVSRREAEKGGLGRRRNLEVIVDGANAANGSRTH